MLFNSVIHCSLRCRFVWSWRYVHEFHVVFIYDQLVATIPFLQKIDDSLLVCIGQFKSWNQPKLHFLAELSNDWTFRLVVLTTCSSFKCVSEFLPSSIFGNLMLVPFDTVVCFCTFNFSTSCWNLSVSRFVS